MGNRAKSAFEIGVGLSKLGWHFGIELGSMALRTADDRFLHPPDVRELRRNMRLHDAYIGFDAVARGRAKNVPELVYLGEAAIVHAVVKAEEDPEVSKQSVEQIVDLALEAGVDPELSPLVGDEEAEKAKELIRHNSKVIHLFRA